MKGPARLATEVVTHPRNREISEDWSFQTGLKTNKQQTTKNHHHYRKTGQIQRIQDQNNTVSLESKIGSLEANGAML